jgi:hypothetical protein
VPDGEERDLMIDQMVRDTLIAITSKGNVVNIQPDEDQRNLRNAVGVQPQDSWMTRLQKNILSAGGL